MRPLSVETLALRGFRNLKDSDLSFGPGFNVISGDNGQGKTNLVEAVYALSTSKSFRATRPGELVRIGGDVASLRGVISEAGERREQSLGLRPGARVTLIEGKRPASLAAYATRTPIVVFHPGEVSLTLGGGGDRRRLLDRLSLYVSPGAAAELEMYTRALRERQRALDARGPGARDAPDWEDLMVRHGLVVRHVRAEASERLSEEARGAFDRIGPPGVTLGVDYAPSFPEDAGAFRECLARSRVADSRRGVATFGPHRDDLRVSIEGRVARGFASQGQHRAIVLSLKAGELGVVSRVTGLRPILVLDDVSSELDRERTAALFAFLADHDGQVFLTTTRPELIALSGSRGHPRRDFSVTSGTVSAAPSLLSP